jgi:Protein of unknown function (DUF559)
LATTAREDIALAGSHFRRQDLIGPVIVDFVSGKARLVIELDGRIDGLLIEIQSALTLPPTPPRKGQGSQSGVSLFEIPGSRSGATGHDPLWRVNPPRS